jgi:hypothetical protein
MSAENGMEFTVKQNLLKLHDCVEDFVLVFSGKKSGKVNGLYYPLAKKIIIYSRNFITDSGEINEALLFYTAMHELAHHIQYTEAGHKSARCHTQLFYAILDDLADKAEELGLYQPVIDAELNEFISEAREISRKIAELQWKLGKVLGRLHEACEQKGVRYEDVLARRVRVARRTERKARNIYAMDLTGDIGLDIQEAAAAEGNGEKRRTILAAGKAGKSVAQVKRSVSKPPDNESETDRLLQEKERIERTIENLKRRLNEIVRRLNTDSGLRPPCAAETRINKAEGAAMVL